MSRGAELLLAQLLADGANCIGEIAIARLPDGTFALTHRDDRERENLQLFHDPDDAREITRFDDAGNFRPLKTAPNLRHGWRLLLRGETAACCAVENFYPGRLAALHEFVRGGLTTTTLRDTLNRQSGMYRVASQICDAQLDTLVANFCRSDGGCLRTIFWKRDANGAVPSTLLPQSKFDPQHDQTGRDDNAIPLLCQEACNLLVAAARAAVKGE